MKVKSIRMALVAALGMVGLASGATITWSVATAPTEGNVGQVLSAGLFDTNGAPVMAENVGGDAVSFDGINFSAGSINFSGGTFDGYHAGDQLLSKTGTHGTNGADTVSLNGLTVGTNYVIQALIFDGRNAVVEPTAPGRTIETDGTNYGQYASGVHNVTWGTGLLLTGTFTADATNQSFTIEAFTTNSVSVGGQLNALTVFDPNGTPEPPPPNATITWSSTPAPVDGDALDTGLFNTNGTLVLAENLGGAVSSFDGIDFSAGTIVFDGTYDGFGTTNDIAATGTYGGSTPDTVSLSGLVSNKEYRVQALVYDGRGTATINGRNAEFDGEDQGVYANGVGGDGLLVTGTFTAVGPEQTFTIEAFYASTSKGGQLNALTVYAVSEPEPVTVSIFGPISGGTAMGISWVGLVGETYGLETNSTLISAEGWISIASGLPGTGGTTTITNTINGDQTFYRVITE